MSELTSVPANAAQRRAAIDVHSLVSVSVTVHERSITIRLRWIFLPVEDVRLVDIAFLGDVIRVFAVFCRLISF